MLSVILIERGQRLSPHSATSVVYSAVLRPHRSASLPAMRTLVLVIAIAWGGVGLTFALLGAWPVAPFIGAEVLFLYIALRWNLRTGNEQEAINLTPTALTVSRVDHWGKQTRTSFPPHWLQINIEPTCSDDNRLELRTHGRSLIIAQFLPPSERVELACALRRELGKLTGG